MTSDYTNSSLYTLLAYGQQAGATATAIIPPESVVVEERLAALCRQPKCPFWGQSMSCPPHTGGPSTMKKKLQSVRHVLVIRLEIQACSLLGEDRPQVLRLLHETVACIEQKAEELGFLRPLGFAGGSCKSSFCAAHPDCSALKKNGNCRYPDQARPSLSGYGVNVGKLMEAAGWSGTLFSGKTDDPDALSWVAGLVLLS